MRKVISIIIICLFFLSGCKNNNVTINYEGKSQNWDISYKIEGTEKTHDSYYTIKFIGNDNKPKGEIRCQIDGPKEGESDLFSLDEKYEHRGKMRVTGGIPSSSDRDIRVKIQWNGKTETALLKRSK
jgi:hypothetical protein